MTYCPVIQLCQLMTNLNMAEHAVVVQRFILSLHISGVQAITSVHKLHNVTHGVSH